MTRSSDDFERQIARIESLIRESSEEVQWNDRIPDPDNPNQSRQIDISVRTACSLTMIECRIHTQTQDVQWIEELIGRRASLRADTVIAVSASGFTRGAIQKAKVHGIILRDMKSLSEQEIRTWGKATEIDAEILFFENASIVFEFDKSNSALVSIEDIEHALLSRSLPLASIFDALIDELRRAYPELPATRITSRSTPKRDMAVNGQQVLGVRICCDFIPGKKIFSTTSIVAYDAPKSDALARNAFVEIVEQGKFEITQSSNTASIAIDVSSIEIPIGAKLGRIGARFTRPVEVREFILLGDIDLGFDLGPFDLGIDFV